MGRKPIDMTGKRIGSLVVLHRTTQDEHPHKTGAGFHAYWTCLCDCGNITYVQGNDLRSNRITTCGHNSLIDITGKKFNRLTVIRKMDIEEYDYDTNEGSRWECRCDCGNITYVRGTDIRLGRIRSCGCLRDEMAKYNLSKKSPSKGEQKIIDILNKEKIKYEREKSFSDEKRISNYRFDFYIPDRNCCIEFQGKQHMVYSPFFHKNRSEFTKAKERDRQKISYCLAHNIKLYCIPYWDIDTIKKLDDLFRDKYLALTKYHNDEVWRLKILEDNT